MNRASLYLCFFLSGASGLVNEVVWSRLFVYTMGSSHLSIAVVVSVFMGGLALGSFLGGKLADRVSSPLRLYGALVGLAGLLCGAVAPLLWIGEPLLGVIYRLNDGEPGHPLFTAAKAILCAASILAPTTLMGATLPALARHLTRDAKEVGARLGALYAVNTFGAVAGAAAAGFYLIERIGLGYCLVLAAAIDVAVGALVLWRTRKSRGQSPAHRLEAPAAPSSRATARVISPGAVRLAILVFCVAGFVNMCLQIGWTRALILSIGNSTYAFTVIVGIFIFGLAAGGFIAGLFADRLKDPMAAFGWLLLATAFAAAATIPWLGMLPARFAWQLAGPSESAGFNFTRFLLAGAGSVALVILPATLLMGMAFPIVGRLRALSSNGLGQAVGSAYAANTLGAILGTALPGFVLLPLLGRVWALLYLAVGLGLLGGLAVLWAAPDPGRIRRRVLAALALGPLLLLGYLTRPAGVLDAPGEERLPWHPVVCALGAYQNFHGAGGYASPEEYARDRVQLLETLYYRDGEAASVAVLRNRGNDHIMLNISGKTDASAGGFTVDLQTQLLMGHLPLLAHPAPRRALTLGLGGGMSLGAMVLHPELEEIDLLELSPEVEEAARLYFAAANESALTNPKVRKIIGDGRNHLTHTARTYDVISSEPSNFWIAGLGSLFTEEFYRLVRRRLNPGGLVCQWIYGYNIRLEDYQTALRTFLVTFPDATVWVSSYGDTLLLGGLEPVVFHRERLSAVLAVARVRASLGPIGISQPEDLFRYFLGAGEPVRRWVGTGPLNRDLFPYLEFKSPLGFFDRGPQVGSRLWEAAEELNDGLFSGFRVEDKQIAAARRRQGRMLGLFLRRLHANSFVKAIDEYRALAKEGEPWSIDCAAGELAAMAPTINKKNPGLLRAARQAHDTPELCAADGAATNPGEDLPARVRALRRGLAEAPSLRWEPFIAMAALEARAGLSDQALQSLDLARARKAPVYKLSYLEGVVRGMQGDLTKAEALLRKAIEETPLQKPRERGEAAYNLGYCYEQMGKPREAASAYRLAIGPGEDPVRSGIALSRCLRKQGLPEEAARAAQDALTASMKLGQESEEARAELTRAIEELKARTAR